MRRIPLALMSLIALAALPLTASAQLGGNTSGTFGSRNLGGTISNPTTGFSGTQQSYSAGVGAQSGAASAQGDAAGVGQVSSSDRFVRGARQPGQFVGGDSAETRAIGNQNSGANGAAGNQMGGLGGNARGAGGLGGLGGNNRLGGGMGQNGRGGTSGLGGLFGAQSDFGGGGAQKKPLRTQLALGFEVPAAKRTVQNTRITTNFQNRLSKLPQLQVNGPLQVALEGQTVVLRGQVATAHDRDLAARLARLEPGISDVRNELTVVPQADGPVAEPIPTPAAETVLPPPAGR